LGKKPKESKGKYNISSLGIKSSGYWVYLIDEIFKK
jgi:hypothetical protein